MLEKQIRDLKKWLGGPEYATKYESITERVFPGMGQ